MGLGNRFDAWMGKLLGAEKPAEADEKPPAGGAGAKGAQADEDGGGAAGAGAEARRPSGPREIAPGMIALDLGEIFEGVRAILEAIDQKLEAGNKGDAILGMVQAVARAAARSDKERDRQFVELRAHITTEFEQLGATLRLDAARQGAVDVFKSLVGALDDVDRVLHGTAAQDERATQPLRMIRRKLKDGFARLGIEEIAVEPRATAFDPKLHEGHAFDGDPKEIDGLAPGTVVRVERAGWRVGEVPIRPAMVTVVPNRGAEAQ